MLAGLSPAAAIAGSRWTFTCRPWSCKNWVGSAFCKNKEMHLKTNVQYCSKISLYDSTLIK